MTVPKDTECAQCVWLRTMTTDEVMHFFAPLMKSDHWQLVSRPEHLRQKAIKKHAAMHLRPDLDELRRTDTQIIGTEADWEPQR